MVRLFSEFAGLGCYNTVLGVVAGLVRAVLVWGLLVAVVVGVWVFGLVLGGVDLGARVLVCWSLSCFLVLPCVGWCGVVLGSLSLL